MIKSKDIEKFFEGAQNKRILDEMSTRLSNVRKVMDAAEAEGSSGAGMVIAKAMGSSEVKSLKIDPSLLQGGMDKEVLEDLIVAAVNDAIRNAKNVGESDLVKFFEKHKSAEDE